MCVNECVPPVRWAARLRLMLLYSTSEPISKSCGLVSESSSAKREMKPLSVGHDHNKDFNWNSINRTRKFKRIVYHLCPSMYLFGTVLSSRCCRRSVSQPFSRGLLARRRSTICPDQIVLELFTTDRSYPPPLPGAGAGLFRDKILSFWHKWPRPLLARSSVSLKRKHHRSPTSVRQHFIFGFPPLQPRGRAGLIRNLHCFVGDPPGSASAAVAVAHNLHPL